MSLLLVLRCFRRWTVLRTRMLQRLNLALRSPDAFGFCGVLLPSPAHLLKVHPLGDVRRSVDVPMISDTT